MRDIKKYTCALKKSIDKELSRKYGFGCVTYYSKGSHEDMDWTLFNKSANAICLAFEETEWQNISDFYDLRQRGIDIEKTMFASTNNINTHKGLIFLQLFLAYSYVYEKKWKDLENFIKTFASPLLKDYKTEFKAMFWDNNGLRDIRNYPLTGYKEIISITNYIYNKDISDTSLTLYLIANVDDTTTFHRSNLDTLRYVQNKASNIADIKDPDIYQEKLEELNNYYISNNISSGGIADLFTTIRTLEFLRKDFDGKNLSQKNK